MSAPLNPTAEWFRCLAEPAREFGSTPLEIRQGRLPPGLRGTLYRNGPARLGRGKTLADHWFDGDGAVLAVAFGDDAASAAYRYVQTEGYLAEAEAGQLLYGNFGMTAPGPVWNQWRRPAKNTANTSVLALPDRLLALWEGGQPHALDLASLATQGLDDLDGTLPSGGPYSAHPKPDPISGDIFNFGISITGPNAGLRLYRSDRHGRIVAQAEHRLHGIPMIHDFVLAGRWLVFLMAPVRARFVPLLLGITSFGDALRWHPELGTQVLVFDRDSLALAARSEVEAGYQWHFGNGAVTTGGLVTLDYARYKDFASNQHLREIASGHTHTPTRASLWRMVLEPTSGRILEHVEVCDRSLEFPMVTPGRVGQPWERTFFAIHRRGTDTTTERYDAIGCFDHVREHLLEADLGDARYPSEPVLAPDTGSDRHWLLTLVYDAAADRGDIWVFDAARLDEGPVCVLGLPQPIPLGFHGCWNGA